MKVVILVRIAKWGLFLASLVWAAYASEFFIFLGTAFPCVGPKNYGLPQFLADMQGYAVVFAPTIVALLILMSKWPRVDKKRRL